MSPRVKAVLRRIVDIFLISTVAAFGARWATENRLAETYKDLLAIEVLAAYDRGVAAGAAQVEPTPKACFNWWFGDNGKARLEQTRKYLCTSKAK